MQDFFLPWGGSIVLSVAWLEVVYRKGRHIKKELNRLSILPKENQTGCSYICTFRFECLYPFVIFTVSNHSHLYSQAGRQRHKESVTQISLYILYTSNLYCTEQIEYPQNRVKFR